MAIKYPLLCLVQTSTTGVGSYAVIETSIRPGYRSLTRAVADGTLNSSDQVYYLCRDSTVVNGGNLFEYGIGTWDNTAKTLSRDSIVQSSNGTVVVSWGVGTRDLYVSDTFAGLFLLASNNLSDVLNKAAARSNLQLGNAALATLGTGNRQVPQMDALGYPAGDMSRGVNIPAPALVHADTLDFDITAKTADYLVQDIDFLIAMDATSGPKNVNLLTAVGRAGKAHIIKKVDVSSNVVLVNGHAGEAIDDSVGYSLPTSKKYVGIVSNGVNWWIWTNN